MSVGARAYLAATVLFLLGDAFAAPIILVQHDPNPSVVGQGIVVRTRFDVVEGSPQPTGTVTIGDATDFCTANLPVGYCLWTPTTAGVKTLTVSYPGDGNYLASSDSGTHTVEAAGNPERVSLGAPFLSFEMSGNLGVDRTVALSADGRYVAFISVNALIPADTNTDYDVYLVDRHSGELSLISVDAGGAAADNSSNAVAISPNGRYVAFASLASDLVAGDANGVGDVFLRDRVANSTVRVSVTNAGAEGNFGSGSPDVSANGRRIAFVSLATLSTNDLNSAGIYEDVYMRDLDAGTTTLISVNMLGDSSAASSTGPSISDDGNRIAFTSSVADLVGSDTNGSTVDAFMRDLAGPSTAVIGLNSGSQQMAEGAYAVQLSPDGSKVLFRSFGSAVPADANSYADCYRRDLQASSTVLVSLKDDDSGPSTAAGITECVFAGNEAAYFTSPAADLVSGTDEANSPDVFKRDLSQATTSRVTGGAVDDLSLNQLVASDDGAQAGFRTNIGALLPGTSGDVVLYDDNPGGFSGLKVDPLGNQMDRALTVTGSGASAVSADARYVAFVATSRNLVLNKINEHPDIFVRDRATGATTRVSVSSNGTEANGGSDSPAISADGRYVAFTSYASNLVPGDTDWQDVFVHDRQLGDTQRISLDPSGAEADGHSHHPMISADGRYVAFESDATNLLGLSGDGNGARDIFRWDRTQPQASAIERISVADDESEANDLSEFASISLDGNKVAFWSLATNLRPSAGPAGQVFLRDVGAGSTTEVSRAVGDIAANGQSFQPMLSGDGTHVAFWTAASNLAPSIVGAQRLLRRNLTSGDYDAVLDTTEAAISVANDQYANLSDDGRYLALATAFQVDPLDTDGIGIDLNIYDFAAGTGRVVLGPGGSEPQADPDRYSVALSGSGEFVTARCAATNLVTADTNGLADLFLFNNPAYMLAFEQDVESLTPTANDASLAPTSDASGRFVVFQSDADNLAPDADVVTDIFRVDTETGAVVSLSVNDDESPITSASIEPSVSADGEVVLFTAEDSGITKLFGESPKTTKARAKGVSWSVLMRNRITGTTQRMGTAQPGGVGTQPQLAPSATGLVYSAPNTDPLMGTVGQVEVFNIPLTRVGDMLVPGAARCVSCKAVNANGSDSNENSNGPSQAPVVSADGLWVAWETGAKNLIVGTPSPCTATVSTEIMLRNLLNGTIQRVSTPPTPTNCGAAGQGSRKPKLDWKGRRIVFESTQPLRPGDANGVADVFLFNADQNSMTRVSETAAGTDGSGASTDATISGDGEMVAFVSAATNLDIEPDTNGRIDAHVRPSIVGGAAATRRLSRTRSGAESDGHSNRPVFNYNGTRLAFDSDAGNLAPGAEAGELNVFQRTNPLNGERIFGTGFE